ncbi:PilZ domain-containing protein [Tsuneonella sp. HG249]
MERRSDERLECDVSAVCRVPATPCRARLIDVSRTGCRFRTLDVMAVPQGSTVHLDFGPGRRVTGQVMWSGPRAAGLKFNRPLSPDLLVMLGLEEAPVVEIEPEVVEETRSMSLAPIAHWLRRLLRPAA